MTLQQYQSTSNTQQKQQIAHTIIKELSIHSACEEEIFYPALKKSVANGEELYNRSLKEHQELKETLFKLDNMSLADDQSLFHSTLQEAIKETLEHVQEEETEILPLFQSAVTPTYLNQLGEQFLSTKNSVPTRPHPAAPASYPLNVPVNHMTAPIDKIRDAAREALDSQTIEETRR